jgi:hypothetical protein
MQTGYLWEDEAFYRAIFIQMENSVYTMFVKIYSLIRRKMIHIVYGYKYEHVELVIFYFTYLIFITSKQNVFHEVLCIRWLRTIYNPEIFRDSSLIAIADANNKSIVFLVL